MEELPEFADVSGRHPPCSGLEQDHAEDSIVCSRAEEPFLGRAGSAVHDYLWLANWYSCPFSETPVLLPFFDAQSGRSFHPFHCRLARLLGPGGIPSHRCGVASPQRLENSCDGLSSPDCASLRRTGSRSQRSASSQSGEGWLPRTATAARHGH